MARRELLVQSRKQRGWSQKDVIHELECRFGIKITESYYGMIEQGVRTPKLELALAIAKLFGGTPEELFCDPKSNKMLDSEHTA